MRFVLNDIRRDLEEAMTTGNTKPMAEAAAAAMKEVAELAVSEGRADIAAAGFRDGYFPWQKSLVSRVFPDGKPSLQPAARIDHKVFIASVFEHGTTIGPRKRALMWLPLDKNLPRSFRGGPRKFSGKLRSARNAKGAPLLIGSAGGKKNVPLFVGVQAATMPRKFHLYETFRRAALRLEEFYNKHLKT